MDHQHSYKSLMMELDQSNFVGKTELPYQFELSILTSHSIYSILQKLEEKREGKKIIVTACWDALI